MFSERLAAAAGHVQTHLNGVLAPLGDSDVVMAMRYAAQGGKRLRAFLVLESARLHGISPEIAIWPAAAIEAMHAYSLVHDDMPCMDDDDLRRGLPTVHVQWNEATAVLCGDALQSLAFELLATPDAHPDPMIRCELALSLARASGAQGMVLGQAMDVAAESSLIPLSLDQITTLQKGKTGALIEWSACAGARLAGVDIAPLAAYAHALGLAFQIADDILDVTGDEQTTGKRLNKDADAGKATFVSLLGLDAAKTRAAELVEQASDALSPYGAEGETLRQAAAFVISRDS